MTPPNANGLPVIVTDHEAAHYTTSLDGLLYPAMSSADLSAEAFAYHVRFAAQAKVEPTLTWDHLANVLTAMYGCGDVWTSSN